MAKRARAQGRSRKTAKKAAKQGTKRAQAGKAPKRAVKKAVKKAVRKRTTAARSPRAAARRPARRRASARPAARPAVRAAARPAARPQVRNGVITHTELASADPAATREWCATVLGWQFGEPMPTPTGPYHMWRFDNGSGGGIRANNPPEVPGSIPYCEVADIQVAYARALAAGAREMLAPEQLGGGMGWIAIVAAPGDVAIGFWAMR
jgi:predicted enzyme related to lactoylglutathione lyase